MRFLSSKARPWESLACLNELGKPLILLFFCSLFTGIIFGDRAGVVVGPTSSEPFSCAPDGDPVFPWKSSADRDWDSSFILSVTIGFGEFNFSQAKIIDICWDLIVGRGGQILLALITYPTLRRSLTLSMERKPMHLPLVSSITLDHSSLASSWVVFRDIVSRFNWRLLAFLQILTYLLIFGTLVRLSQERDFHDWQSYLQLTVSAKVSAMTAYQAQATPWFKEADSGKMVDSHLIQVVSSLTVRDGDRIGLQPNAQLFSNLSADYSTLRDYGKDANRTSVPAGYAREGQDSMFGQPDHGVFGKDGFIYTYQLAWERADGGIDLLNSTLQLENGNFSLQKPPLDIIEVPKSYLYAGNAIQTDWLEENTLCQPLQTYQWGFSSVLLFVFCIMTIMFTAALLALSSEVWFRSRAARYKYHHSKYRDILDLAEEIKNEIGDEAENMTPEELDRRIRTKTGRIRIETDELPLSRSQELDAKYSTKDVDLEDKPVERRERLVS